MICQFYSKARSPLTKFLRPKLSKIGSIWRAYKTSCVLHDQTIKPTPIFSVGVGLKVKVPGLKRADREGSDPFGPSRGGEAEGVGRDGGVGRSTRDRLRQVDIQPL